MFLQQNIRYSLSSDDLGGGLALSGRSQIAVAYEDVLDQHLSQARKPSPEHLAPAIIESMQEGLLGVLTSRTRGQAEVTRSEFSVEIVASHVGASMERRPFIAALAYAKSETGLHAVILANHAYMVEVGEVGLAVVHPVRDLRPQASLIITPLFSQSAFYNELESLVGLTQASYLRGTRPSYLLTRMLEIVESPGNIAICGKLFDWSVEDHSRGIVLVTKTTV